MSDARREHAHAGEALLLGEAREHLTTFGHVVRHDEHRLDDPLLDDRDELGFVPDHLAVGTLTANLEALSRCGRQRCREAALIGLGHRGIDVVVDAAREHAIHREVGQHSVDGTDAALAVGEEDEVWQVLREHAPPLVAPLSVPFEELALRDVEERDDRSVQHSACAQDGLGAENGPRDLAGRLAHTQGHGARSLARGQHDRDRVFAGRKGRAVLSQRLGLEVGDEPFREGIPAEPEDAQRLGVGRANRSVARNVNDTARYCVEDATQQLLALVERLDVVWRSLHDAL